MNLLLLAGSLAAVGAQALPQSDTVTEKVRLRYRKASELMLASPLPKGLEELTLNLKENSVTLRGTQRAVGRLMQHIWNNDGAGRIVQLDIRIYRHTVDVNGKATEQLVSNPSASVNDSSSVTLATGLGTRSFVIQAMPFAFAKDRGKIEASYRLIDRNGKALSVGSNTRLVKLDEFTRIGGSTESDDEEIYAPVEKGLVPAGKTGFTAFFIDVRVTEPPDAQPPKS